MSGEWSPTLKELAKKPELLASGHRLCAGCAAGTIIRAILKAAWKPIVAVNATGCLEVATTIYPYTSWRIPWIHNAFENAAATAAGIARARDKLLRDGRLDKDYHVIAFAGDGGTYDIGIQALSGALERREKILYVLYDNEAYMNTGIQRSGGTPMAAWTTTSPAGRKIPGKIEWKKPIARIVAAHDVPYVATATPWQWRDLVVKARKALEADGPAFLHVLSPCPRGWRFDTNLSIEMARLAVQTCFFPLYEIVDGEKYVITGYSRSIAMNPKLKKPVVEYLKPQGRFRHLFKPENARLLEEIQRRVDYEWERLLKLAGYRS
ncbi:MAG: pyruvate ferredoxin oxidoreductase [Thermoproteota archaeon]|nr:MAG: pyruvate ferredoxin oxidoreductase [Candidatus Korarchaeota archaeon]